MPRGGYRPGSGRKKGTKDKKPRKKSDAQIEAENIKIMLSQGKKAKAKLFNDYLIRVKNGEKVSITEKKLMDKVEAELKAEVSGKKIKTGNETPLEYMLRVMNDPLEDKEMRARMAIAVAPYIHPKVGEGKGKKQEREDRAKEAGKGRFGAGKPPLKVVK